MGWEIIIAAVFASMVTRSWEHSRRRSKAKWEEARREAREHAEQRAKDRVKRAEERAQRRRDRVDAARQTGPTDAMWWAWGTGWLVAAAARASYAAAAGAREGGAAGAREGYRVGRDRVRARRERANEDAAAGKGRHTGGDNPSAHPECARCGRPCLPISDRERPYRITPNGPLVCRHCWWDAHLRLLDDERPCQRCGHHRSGIVKLAETNETKRLCLTCYEDALAEPANTPSRDGGPADMVACTTCGVYVAASAVDVAGRCLQCTPRPAEDDRAAEPGRDETHEGEVVDSTDEPAQEGTDTMTESTAGHAINMNGATMSGGDGEGYASTLALLTQVGQLLEHVDGVMNDLGDMVASKRVDNATVQGVSDVEDNLQAASNRCGELLKHVQAKHEEVAAAVAGAGGSAEVADTDWYDNY